MEVLAPSICDQLSTSLLQLQLYNVCVKWLTDEQEKALLLLTSLQKLEFNSCDDLLSLPTQLYQLSSLRKLKIRWCPAITSLPQSDLPSSLQTLKLGDECSDELKERCQDLEYIPNIYIDDNWIKGKGENNSYDSDEDYD